VIQERDANNVPTLTLTRRGNRLLARSDMTTATPTHAYFHMDGNANVTAMVNAQQVIVATYVYDPFGNVLSKAGPLADANSYRFSSQEYHQNSGLLLYLRRAYDPNLQRWLNRDPIQEAGGINLYTFVSNNAVDGIDPFGFSDINAPPSRASCPINPCRGNRTKVRDDAGESCCAEQMLTVTLWNYTPPFPQIPHTFLQTPLGTFGFYPAFNEWPLAPGAVRNDVRHPRSGTGQPYRACPKTVKRLDDSITEHQGGWWGDWYAVQNPYGAYNCTGWACARLADAGLTPPSNPNIPFLNPWSNENRMNPAP